LGMFYVKATLLRFPDMRYTMRDGGLHLVILANALQRGEFWHYVRKPRIKTTLLAILVKAFFTPLMLGFFSGHCNSIADAWLRHKHLPTLHFNLPKADAIHQALAWFQQIRARLPDILPAASDFSGLFAPSTWTKPDVRWALDLAYDMVFFVDC